MLKDKIVRARFFSWHHFTPIIVITAAIIVIFVNKVSSLYHLHAQEEEQEIEYSFSIISGKNN